jgi:hypothetical protein
MIKKIYMAAGVQSKSSCLGKSQPLRHVVLHSPTGFG